MLSVLGIGSLPYAFTHAAGNAVSFLHSELRTGGPYCGSIGEEAFVCDNVIENLNPIRAEVERARQLTKGFRAKRLNHIVQLEADRFNYFAN